MCYSAMVEQDAKAYGLRYKARIQSNLYEDLFRRRLAGEKLYINKAMELPFLQNPDGPTEKSIAEIISAWKTQQTSQLQSEIFVQKSRYDDAVRALQSKPTKKAENDRRISAKKIDKIKLDLMRLNSLELTETDQRIFPYHYMSMIYVDEKGEKVVAPFRYHMRPHDRNEDFDKKYEGCYNARFNNLNRVAFWKHSLEQKRGFILVRKFYENVPTEKYLKNHKLGADQREKKNIVLCFDPKLPDYMILPTLWDEWTEKGKPTLRSAALITDDPHPEVAEAGHDRTPINLKESAAEAWLYAPTLEDAVAILKNQRERPFFSHEVLGVA